MNTLPDLSQLTHEQLLEFTRQLAMQHQQLAEDNQQLDTKVQHLEACNQHLSILNQKYEHELALFKQHKFGSKNEHLTAKQIHLWDEAVEEDIAAVDLELERLNADKTNAATQKAKTNKPKRRPLPDHLHTIRIEHEPASTQCACGCQLRRIGEDVSEKLHFRPAQFYKEQHVRGKWVCDQCDTLTQQAMPAYVIDKGIASPELLSHVLVSKYADHLPLYRQRLIYQRAGIELSRSTLSDWIGRCGVELEPLANALKQVVLQQRVLHADETPVTIMRMGDDEKKPKKGYVWAYATTQYNPVQAVIYDFQDSRSGQHAEEFLKGWQGYLVCDDYSGYKARFKSGQVIEVGCMAHARRKFHELHVTGKSQVAEQALVLIQKLYAIADLKPIYRADTKGAAEVALDELEEKWGEKYGVVIQSWRTKWHLLSAYFKYPKAIRKPIYTTNAVEAVHRQFRKLTKTKGAFPNEDSLMKLLYIGIQQASEKWTMPIQEWGQTITQLSIYFEGRLDDIIKI